ncbi:MAG: glycogen/starch synthase [Nanoarchaeota archaeon]
MNKKVDYLFEIAWEVCNKVGGIYTVVRSKSAQMIKHYKGNYVAIGPYFADKVGHDFLPKDPDDKLKHVFDKLKRKNIVAHYGTWLIESKPNTILIDYSRFFSSKDEIKGGMWNDYHIDSINSAYDYDEPVVWATAVGVLLEELSNVLHCNIVAHFHEWLAGPGLLYLKKHNVPIGTVFTTHATTLGRTMAASNFELYAKKNKSYLLESLDINKLAYDYGVPAKHQLEKATAQHADVFTTVSKITAIEAKYILGRDPDILVPNGLDPAKIPDAEETHIKHKLYKSKIMEFLIPYFSPYYPIDVKDTYIFFISGRYEFKNKGIDVTIKALSLLNNKLQKERSKKNVVVLFLIPANVKNPKPSVIESKALYEDMEDSVDDNLNNIRENIVHSLAMQKLPTQMEIFSKDFLNDINQKMLSIKRDGDPPLSTHDLHGDKDTILESFAEFGLLNQKKDKVKVIFYPCYLTSSDGLLDLDYNSTMWGTQLGIFPSYYEPWGYTPLECAGFGIPSLTTDLAGFGKYLEEEGKDSGIFLIRREGKTEKNVIDQIYTRFYKYVSLSKENRLKYKSKVQRFARQCSWDSLIKNYIDAHNLAVKK